MRRWAVTTLGELVKLQRGHDLPKKERVSGPYPVVGSTGILDSHVHFKYRGPGVMIGRSGVIGGAQYIKSNFWPLNTTLFVRDFRGNDPRWVYYLLKTVDFTGYNSGSAQPSLNRNYVAGIELPLAPLTEQRGIAATLGALDDKIDSNRRAIELMERHALLRFQKLFDVQHDPDGIAISDLVHVNRRHRMAKGLRATYVGMSSLPMFSPVIDEWVSKAAGSGQKFVNGDVLMARITPCLENGKTAIVDMLEDGEIGWGSTEYVVLSPRGEITTPWIYCLLRNVEVRSWAIRRMTGSSGRQRFSADGFKEYRVPRPTPDALGEFNQTANPMFSRMTQFRDESRKLEALRDALLPELLSGRIRVPEAAEAVASV
ncbi:restriction endonuclease subunit S [Nesterenkonia sphaerica]|uniref:restriction endonuclease subunit S n=1 Tax=Nesterenkonia sphaerica TaxID=1804988 RepID=UPI00140782DF|nr:restriction endonuclease subunit S [Nesterenkonia sphaerica]